MAVDLKEIKQKLYNNLKESGWADKLKGFLLSSDFDDILEKLYNDAINGKRFTPIIKQIFRAFEECPYSELKVVMLTQDPYLQPKVADGIGFSCSNDNKVQPALKAIYGEVQDTVYPEEGCTWYPDLARWSKQGVLLINTPLTAEIGKYNKHQELWRPFMNYLLDILTREHTDMVYVFIGDPAQNWISRVPETNYKLFTSHPASAGYNNRKWDSNNLFNRINEIIETSSGATIKW